MSLKDRTVAFIGSGVMGEAMIKGLLAKQLITPEQLIAADPHEPRGKELVERYSLRFTPDNAEAARQADVVVLSVKPQVMTKVLHSIYGRVQKEALVLSIAAGVPTSTIMKGCEVSDVVRAMPNTPGQIGEGMTVAYPTPSVSGDQRAWADMILGALGQTLFVPEERFMDMATALNGSGPSYVFLLMEALIDAGVHMGFSRHDSQMLVQQTMLGSVKYAIESGLHPAELRNQVTSPGGTSAAALYQLEKGGVRTTISQAVWAAYKRSVELGQENGKRADHDS